MVRGETLKTHAIEFSAWLESNCFVKTGKNGFEYMSEQVTGLGYQPVEFMYDYWLYHVKGRKAASKTKSYYKSLKA